jgi:seryl-tRNA synthetase
MRLLTELLPTVMADAKRVADEFVRQTAAEDASQDDIAAELSVLQTQQDLIGEQIAELAAKGIKAPALLHDKLRDIQDRMAELSVQQEQRQEQRWDMDRIRLLANALADNPAHYFETLDDDSKARVLRALVRDVRILGEGLGMSRRHRIIRYTSVLTGETWAEGNLECCTPR